MITINNPYTGLLNLMHQQGKVRATTAICLGSVENVWPLAIKTGDLILDNDDLLITHTLVGEQTIHLEKGDVVAMMPTENRQTYIVLCKVVKV